MMNHITCAVFLLGPTRYHESHYVCSVLPGSCSLSWITLCVQCFHWVSKTDKFQIFQDVIMHKYFTSLYNSILNCSEDNNFFSPFCKISQWLVAKNTMYIHCPCEQEHYLYPLSMWSRTLCIFIVHVNKNTVYPLSMWTRTLSISIVNNQIGRLSVTQNDDSPGYLLVKVKKQFKFAYNQMFDGLL